MKIEMIKEGKLGTRPSWHEYGMGFAIWASNRASCWHVHAGSAITIDNHLIGTGYNGASSKIKKNCLETGCRKELKGFEYKSSLNSRSCIGTHAEMNAISNLTRMMPKHAAIYNTIFPCHGCAKDLLPYEIGTIVFKKSYSDSELKNTLELLEEANVKVCQLDMSLLRYWDIQVNHPHVDFDVWSGEEKEEARKMLAFYHDMRKI